jgi:RNase P subunit RPR2
MESARADHCPNCDATSVTNLVHVRTGDPVRVYVKCNACGCYVARYTLSRYTSDQPYESLLRLLRQYAYASGKRCLEEVEEFGTVIKAEFERVERLVAAAGEQRRVEELIEDVRRAEKSDG